MRKKSLIGQKTNPFTCRCTVNDYKKYRTEIYYKKYIYRLLRAIPHGNT